MSGIYSKFLIFDGALSCADWPDVNFFHGHENTVITPQQFLAATEHLVKPRVTIEDYIKEKLLTLPDRDRKKLLYGEWVPQNEGDEPSKPETEL